MNAASAYRSGKSGFFVQGVFLGYVWQKMACWALAGAKERAFNICSGGNGDAASGGKGHCTLRAMHGMHTSAGARPAHRAARIRVSGSIGKRVVARGKADIGFPALFSVILRRRSIMKSFLTLCSLYCNRLVIAIVAVCKVCIMLLCVFMTVITLLQVFFRFVFYVPFPASEELARFSMSWMAMLGCVVALRMGRHLGVRVLVDRLPSGVYDTYMAPVIQLIMLAFFYIITANGWDLALRNAGQLSPAMEISMFYPYLSVPVGGALMFLVVLADMLQDHFPTAAGSTASIASAVLEELPPPAHPRMDVNPFDDDPAHATQATPAASSADDTTEPRA